MAGLVSRITIGRTVPAPAGSKRVEDGLKRGAGLNYCVERDGRAGEIWLKVRVAKCSGGVSLTIIEFFAYDVLIFKNLEARFWDLRGRGWRRSRLRTATTRTTLSIAMIVLNRFGHIDGMGISVRVSPATNFRVSRDPDTIQRQVS